MNRRDFMRRMFGLTVTIAVGPKLIYTLTDGANTAYYGLSALESNGTIGTWMGVTRSMKPQFTPWVGPATGGKTIRADMIKLIEKMMNNALDKHWEIIIANQEQIDAYEKLKKLG